MGVSLRPVEANSSGSRRAWGVERGWVKVAWGAAGIGAGIGAERCGLNVKGEVSSGGPFSAFESVSQMTHDIWKQQIGGHTRSISKSAF